MAAWRVRVTLLAALAVVLGVFQSSIRHGGGGLVRAERVRKSWSSFSDKEKELYLGALRKGMENGWHYKFAEIHSALPTYDHAHANCGFLLWHRKFLLAYENMLRAQGEQFKDVTLPYWNYFQDHDKHLSPNVDCNSWATCSKFLSDMGGSTPNAPWKKLAVGRASVDGICVANEVTKYACDGRSASSSDTKPCEQCIVRGEWYKQSNFLQISKGQITTAIREIGAKATSAANAHDVLRYHLEMGFHADVHNALSGVMKTSASPFDPVFYGHHGTIDLLHFIHNRCTFGKKQDSKKFDVFTYCDVQVKQTEGSFKTVRIYGDSTIVMYYQNQPVEDHPEIGKFFKGIGKTYREFANAQRLRDPRNSYRYEVDRYFEKILKSEGIQCPASVYASTQNKPNRHHHKQGNDDGDAYATEDASDDFSALDEMIETLAVCGKELQARVPNTTHVDIAVQESILECEATRQSSGEEPQDYSQEFRQTFRIPTDDVPHCYGLLSEVKKGALKVEFSDRCRQVYGRLTGTNLTEADFGKPLPLQNDSDMNSATQTPSREGEESSDSDSYDSADLSSDSYDSVESADSEQVVTTQPRKPHWHISIEIHTQ